MDDKTRSEHIEEAARNFYEATFENEHDGHIVGALIGHRVLLGEALNLPPDPPRGDDHISQEAWKACAHSVPQGADQLHGICVFCYRDRLGAALREIRRLSDPPRGGGWDALRELRDRLPHLRTSGGQRLPGHPMAMIRDEIDRLLAAAPKPTEVSLLDLPPRREIDRLLDSLRPRHYDGVGFAVLWADVELQARAIMCTPYIRTETSRTELAAKKSEPAERQCAKCGYLMCGPICTKCGALPSESPAFDMLAHLRRQREWSERTFGPGARAAGIGDHIRKELDEIASAPGDLEEWIDVVILALDGAWRSGASPEAIVAQLVAKQAKNEGRNWPDWRTADPNAAIQHVKPAESAAEPAQDANESTPMGGHGDPHQSVTREGSAMTEAAGSTPASGTTSEPAHDTVVKHWRAFNESEAMNHSEPEQNDALERLRQINSEHVDPSPDVERLRQELRGWLNNLSGAVAIISENNAAMRSAGYPGPEIRDQIRQVLEHRDDLRAEVADLGEMLAAERGDNANKDAEITDLRAKLEEREADMHDRIRRDYDKTVADSWRKANDDLRAKLAAAEARIIEIRGIAKEFFYWTVHNESPKESANRMRVTLKRIAELGDGGA